MSTHVMADQMSLPPPVHLELTDGDRVVGWINDHAIGFRGFANEAEAMGAAWTAYTVVARKLSRRDGTRPMPIDVEPLDLVRREDREVILASNREIATLVRPGDPERRTDALSFGFELAIPGVSDELTQRSLAHLAYRTLRRSGVRWTMWIPDTPRNGRFRPDRIENVVRADGETGDESHAAPADRDDAVSGRPGRRLAYSARRPPDGRFRSPEYPLSRR